MVLNTLIFEDIVLQELSDIQKSKGASTDTAIINRTFERVVQSINSDHTFIVDGITKVSEISAAYNTDW